MADEEIHAGAPHRLLRRLAPGDEFPLPGRLEEHVLRRHDPLLLRPLVRILRPAADLDGSSRGDRITLRIGLLFGFDGSYRIPLPVRFDFGFETIAHRGSPRSRNKSSAINGVSALPEACEHRQGEEPPA